MHKYLQVIHITELLTFVILHHFSQFVIRFILLYIRLPSCKYNIEVLIKHNQGQEIEQSEWSHVLIPVSRTPRCPMASLPWKKINQLD